MAGQHWAAPGYAETVVSPDLRAKLIERVRRIVDGEYGSDAQVEHLLRRLERHLLDPQLTAYIFWPDRRMTPAEIVDRALAYRPIVAGYSGPADSPED